MDLVSGETFASVVQAALTTGTGGSADIMVRNANTGSAIVTADLTNITVTYDADTAELVFRDSAGRAMGFGYDGSANALHGLGIGPLLDEVILGHRINRLQLKRDFSGAAQGDVINASEITLTFSTSDASFNFTLNGQYLRWKLLPTRVLRWLLQFLLILEPMFQHCKNKLNALMTTLNGVHP